MKVYELKRCEITVDQLKELVDHLPENPTPEIADDVRTLWGLFMQNSSIAGSSVLVTRLSDEFVEVMNISDLVVD